jgi:hypothetical protein
MNDTKDGFYEEVEHIFYQFPKFHMKILLQNFCINVEEEIFSN